jgi:hypothetical protein
MNVALAAFRRAKSANDFPGVIETLKRFGIPEDIIKNALKQVKAELKKKSRN